MAWIRLVLSGEELDKLADEIYTDRRIAGQVYCGRCGYNLRTLPYLYRCPECGQEYNARPLVMKGIFLPQQATVPALDTLAVFFWSATATVLVIYGSQPISKWMLAMAAASGIMAVIFLHRVWTQWHDLIHALRIARRIRREEEDW